MFRNLLVALSLCLTGCIFVVEPNQGTDSSSSDWGYYDLWINDTYISCEYDADVYPAPKSYWYFEADVGTTYDYYDAEIEVGFYIDGGTWVGMVPAGAGIWVKNLDSFYWSCYDERYFDFEATDAYGNWSTFTVWW